jgi:hypothetical protein
MTGLRLVLAGVLFAANSHAAPVPYYTPQTLASRVMATEVFHPGENHRGPEFYKTLGQAGRNIGCGAKFWLAANGVPGKVFHGGLVGTGMVEVELLADRPAEIRSGMFSDSVPQKFYGIASFTRGRGDMHPWQALPDVLGLSLGLDIGGRWVAMTMTASGGAFGKTHLEFSDLAGFTGFAGSWAQYLTGWAPSIVQSAAGRLGGMAGEGLFILRHPLSGLFVLAPATINNGPVRSSPYLGYGNVGFGSGHAYLLDESVPFSRRRAFKYGVRLVDNEANAQILKERAGFWNYTKAAFQGVFKSKAISDDFHHWNRMRDIEFELYIQLDDPLTPENTPIEDPRWRWKTEVIPVARIKLLQELPVTDRGQGVGIADVNLANDLRTFADRMSFNPGFGLHIPLGDLGVGRGVGAVMGRPRPGSPTGSETGSYWKSQQMRGAVGFSSGDLEMAEIESFTRQLGSLHSRYRASAP